jgi:hypothetical protein
MTPNIMKAVKDVYTQGDPMDYTWVDLGEFDHMADAKYDKVMNAIPDLFNSDPKDLMLPFEQMGIVRVSSSVGKPISITPVSYTHLTLPTID